MRVPKKLSFSQRRAQLSVFQGALDHYTAVIGSGLGSRADTSIFTVTVLAAFALVDEPDAPPQCINGGHTDGVRFWRLAFDPTCAG